MVLDGKISSIEELFMEGLKIRESEIVDVLLPDLQEEVINIGLVQKQTDAGEKSQFRAIVVVGNRDGYVGLGSGKAKQVRSAIEKAAELAGEDRPEIYSARMGLLYAANDEQQDNE